MQVVAYRRLKTGKSQTFSATSGCGRLREVPNIVICLGNFWYFEKLVDEERWSQPEVDCISSVDVMPVYSRVRVKARL